MTMREQFEAYYKARYPKAYMERNTAANGGSYMSFEVQRSYDMWVASRTALWPWRTFASAVPADGQHIWARVKGEPTSIYNTHYDLTAAWDAEDEWMPAPDILDIQILCQP